jgi:hypothetical protein
MGCSSRKRFIAWTLLSFLPWGCDSGPTAPVTSSPQTSSLSTASLGGVSDGQGKTWRQLTETTGLSWTQVAQACPRDGARPCNGVVGGRDLNGWVWATAKQVRALLALYEDDILTSPSVSGSQYYSTADTFLMSFRPTFSYAFTYQAGQHAAGWTSSKDPNRAPIAGSVGNGHNMVSISGSFSIVAVANPNEVSSERGVFLWHADGSGGGNSIDAVNDAGSTRTSGGTAVANVLANDLLAGAPATLALVTLSQHSSSDPGVTLDPGDGSVDVASGASGGVKQLEYRICETASPTNCDQATVTVTVVASVIDAVNDVGSASSVSGGTAVANVLANDRLDGVQATTGNVIPSFVSATNGGVTLDTADGSVDVAAGTTGGAHSLVYRICERASPSNCDQATVTVNVAPQSIVVSMTTLAVKEGGVGSFTVRLSQRPAANVIVSVAFFQGTAVVAPTPTTLTFTTANWNTAAAVTFQARHDSDKYNNAATIHLSSPGIATVAVVARINDDDRSAGHPMAIIDAPLNAQTVSGIINLRGTGTDSNGQIVESRFYVDDDRIFTDERTGTTVTMTRGWNTRSVANGWHTLEFRATDNSDNDGRMLITVFVSN